MLKAYFIKTDAGHAGTDNYGVIVAKDFAAAEKLCYKLAVDWAESHGVYDCGDGEFCYEDDEDYTFDIGYEVVLEITTEEDFERISGYEASSKCFRSELTEMGFGIKGAK